MVRVKMKVKKVRIKARVSTLLTRLGIG